VLRSSGFQHHDVVDDSTEQPVDQVRARLDALAQSLIDRFGDDVTVQFKEHANLRMTSVAPASDNACIIDWIEMTHEIILSVGKQGGRWELPRDMESVQHIEQIADAVVAGRVREQIRGRTARITVTLADGTEERSAVSDWTVRGGHFWRRAPSHVVDYSPYR
jgi:hypothetical protein